MKTYFILITLGGNRPTEDRVRESVPKVIKVIESISKDYHLAFRSVNGSAFAYFLNSKLPADGIRAQINSPGGHLVGQERRDSIILSDPLLPEDKCLVFEVGEEFSHIGLGRVHAWIQHHSK